MSLHLFFTNCSIKLTGSEQKKNCYVVDEIRLNYFHYVCLRKLKFTVKYLETKMLFHYFTKPLKYKINHHNTQKFKIQLQTHRSS